MSVETSDVPGAAEPAASEEEILAALTRHIIEVADPMVAPIATALATAAFRRRSSMDVFSGDLERLAVVVTEAARFLSNRRPDEIGVRVAQPDDGGTVIHINTEDGPFLVSTLTEELSRRGLEVAHLLHPILGVERTDDGTVTAILPARHADHRESWIFVRLTERLEDAKRERLRDDIAVVIRDAKRVTKDFEALTARVEAMAESAVSDVAGVGQTSGADVPAEEADEAAAFLRWLLDDHFVFLGARDLRIVDGDDPSRVEVVPGSGLGIWGDRDGQRPPEADAERARAEAGSFSTDPDALLVLSRTEQRSTVHRNERMLRMAMKQFDGGRVVGHREVVGLLSQKAFAQPATSIPVLRRKLRDILELEDVVDHSHEERALRTLFEAIPKHELFAMSTADLRTALVELVSAQKQQLVRLVVRQDEGAAAALITMPRDRFNADLRRKLQRLLTQRLHAHSVDYHLSLTEGDQALLHFAMTTKGRPEVRFDELQREVLELSRTWQDRLMAAARREGTERSSVRAGRQARNHGELAARWGPMLPSTYTAAVIPSEAIGDIAELDALVGDDGEVRVRVVASSPSRLRVKLFKLGEGIELSSVLPMLESLGLVAVEEVPHRIELDNGHEAADVAHIHSVEVRGADLRDFNVDTDGERLSAALLAIWNGRAAADSLNRLVIAAELDWRDVDLLRAYRRYRRQVGTSFTEAYQNDALYQYPEIARALVDLFTARFTPDIDDPDERHAAAEGARQRVLDELDDVTRLDQDRILRGLLGLVDATLRTNYFVSPRRPWVSLKFDSAAVPGMPKPVPFREIYVFSPEMEGIHLRGGTVARGGLRWSDRVEDVRTEVLGLMKAQVIKNSMIVPTGSKGGFVLKRRPDDPQQLREVVEEQYAVFIRGMLDLTDNVVGGKVIPPDGVHAEDEDDPYLVVAADRGTATFSDLANSISNEYGFWLRDAFASGGSRGYDHKEMGITARGAWETVRRHFYELDIDVQSEPIRITAIGDMSGDVCGNGLLQSQAVKVVAAFDHRDIFIDPSPDPELSFAERKRLYEKPRSSWQDYDKSKISRGGGVWSRTAKSIPLSAEMRDLLKVDDDALPPPEVIRAILHAPTDLLFAGGIGTFVKAASEAHDDVGDRANDAIRVNGSEIGARVVGEGGNLAVTQRGRIEYARRGGRINLDAIDNAAGVATSDAEVNLKILLRVALDSGELDDEGRDEVLAQVREDVAADVLHHVWRQAWAISRELEGSPAAVESYEQLLIDLESAAVVDRDVDVLPSTDEMAHRRDVGAGLTRPELGILLGASKRDLIARLLATDLPDDAALRPLLTGAFPAAVCERFDHLLDEHRLRRELIATRLAGEIVDRMGITYVNRTVHERGCSVGDVVSAYWVARQALGVADVWRRVDELEGTIVPALQMEMATEIDTVLDACARAYLREIPVSSMSDLIASDRRAFDDLRRYVDGLRGAHAAVRDRRVGRWTDVGIDDDLAAAIATLASLTLGPDVADAARRLDRDVHAVADAFISVTDRLPLDAIHGHLERVTPVSRWERWQLRALVDELRELRRHIAMAALSHHRGDDGHDGEQAVRRYLGGRERQIDRVKKLMSHLERDHDAGLAAVTVVVTALRGVLD